MAVTVTIDEDRVEEIVTPVIEGEKRGEKLEREIQGALEDVFEEYAGQVEEFAMTQQQIEQDAAFQMADYLVDNVVIDGVKLRDMVGGPEDWVLKKNRNSLKKTTTVSWDGPSMEELEGYFMNTV